MLPRPVHCASAARRYAGGRAVKLGQPVEVVFVAVYYALLVASPSSALATAMALRFDGVTMRHDATDWRVWARSHVDADAFWWVTLRIEGTSINATSWTGAPEPMLVDDGGRAELGEALMRHVAASSEFDFALWGPEAQDAFFDVETGRSDVRLDPRRLATGWPGLVVARALWEAIGEPAGFVPYCDRYLRAVEDRG